MQDRSILNKQSENNTSSGFFLPSEYKEQWQSLVAESFVDAFSDLLEDSI